MRILVTSFVFAPSIGGVETLTDTLARAFVEAGNDVTVVTDTPFEGTDIYPYKVVRCPARPKMRELIKWSDVVWQNNVSLRMGWPLLFSRHPMVITHGGFQAARRTTSPSVLFQKLLCGRSYNVGVSKFVSDSIPGAQVAIGNPFGTDFGLIEGIERARDIAFVGRVVPEKGPILLVEALSSLKRAGRELTATIIGDGTERSALEDRAKAEGLDIRFTGARDPVAIAKELNAHRILAIPSVWEEPFGIVALEGLACGCRLVASNRGGLPEASGPGAVLFELTDPPDQTSSDNLAAALALALDEPMAPSSEAAARAHLEAHSAAAVGAQYLDIFERVVKGSAA
jgi:glycosyltransferase involved in cell wall biosynthesis